jgi:hypothetical protein
MAVRTAQELRDRASEFRAMAVNGCDLHLQALLLLVAEEFDREAMTLDDDDDGDEPGLIRPRRQREP